MTVVGRYDSTLQMFVEEAREPVRTRLAFLRWLGEQNRLEHEVYGPSSGALADTEAPCASDDLLLAS